MSRAADSDIIGTAPDPLAGLPLSLQREASPEAARPVPRVAMQSGRELAKGDADRTLSARQHKIVLALQGHGPLNRFELHEVTGLTENSVNSGCNALLKAGVLAHHSYDLERRRERLTLAPPREGVHQSDCACANCETYREMLDDEMRRFVAPSTPTEPTP